MKQCVKSVLWLRPGWDRLGDIEHAFDDARACKPYAGRNLPDRVGRPRNLAVGHLLGHVEQEPTVRFFNATHQPAELAQKTCLFAGTAPNDIVSAFALRKIGEFGWFLSVIEELIKGDFQSAGHFFQCFNGRNGMAVFYA